MLATPVVVVTTVPRTVLAVTLLLLVVFDEVLGLCRRR